MYDHTHVTPQYLLSHGFRLYTSKEDGDLCDMPWQDGAVHFMEIKGARQLFVVIFIEGQEPDEPFISVEVQQDAGCGFIEMPFPWHGLPIEYFESVYFGIRGEKPVLTPVAAEDTQYEIIQPKQIT